MQVACCKEGDATDSPAWFHWRYSAFYHHPRSSYVVYSYSSIHNTSRCLRNSPEKKRQQFRFWYYLELNNIVYYNLHNKNILAL